MFLERFCLFVKCSVGPVYWGVDGPVVVVGLGMIVVVVYGDRSG